LRQKTGRSGQSGSTLTDEAALDARVCECCQTSAALTDEGPIVVYRDRSPEEIRDISILRWRKGKWSEPRPIFRDNWQINGCPVNGPSIAATGRRVAVAWYTAVDNQPRVKLAFSADGGETFTAPMTVDGGNPAGRVDVQLLPDGSAIVSWLEKLSSGGGEVRVRRVKADGKLGDAVAVSAPGAARSNGFPQMVRVGNELIFAWTGPRVLTAVLPLP
jgi:hypothetical protein